MTATTLPAGFKYKAAFFAGRPCHSDDHFSFLHPKMDRRRRAKIFAPFDALEGYSESIDSKNIEYVERIDLEEDDRRELNRRIQILHALTYNGKMARANRVQISVSYYVPCADEHNFAYQLRGRYKTISGICWKVDSDVTNTIKIDEAVISLTDVIEITAADENIFKKDEWIAC